MEPLVEPLFVNGRGPNWRHPGRKAPTTRPPGRCAFSHSHVLVAGPRELALRRPKACPLGCSKPFPFHPPTVPAARRRSTGIWLEPVPGRQLLRNGKVWPITRIWVVWNAADQASSLATTPSQQRLRGPGRLVCLYPARWTAAGGWRAGTTPAKGLLWRLDHQHLSKVARSREIAPPGTDSEVKGLVWTCRP